MPQSIHFISIGGSAMHNLALALQQQGHIVTGSDETIYEPSRTRLQQQNLLPTETGWFPDKINLKNGQSGLDAVIVGMHAGKDNPELVKALELGLPVYSYPEFIYQQSQQKQRVVIAGSHGKTTITAIILHVLTHHNRTFDYWIGDPIDGFDTTVRLSSTAPLIIIEGDEYASSPIDSRPKFLHYQPHIALISGIAWDHINLYPTWDEYVDQFESLAEAMPKAGILIFDESDDMLDVIGQKERTDITKIPYFPHPSEVVDGHTYLITKLNKRIPINLFGQHNLKNIAGAITVCDRIGITEDQFYEAIPSFKGVSERLEKVAENNGRILFRDFAHSPAKVEATTEAVKQQYSDKKLLAAVELHTVSSLNKAFLEQYKDTMDAADKAIVFAEVQPLTENHQISITPNDIMAAFDRPDLRVFTDVIALQDYLLEQRNAAQVFLLMSSGTFGGLDLKAITKLLIP
ncbi:UDP-N-acetylmuramate--L-alanine ligase [Spirosoma areae]